MLRKLKKLACRILPDGAEPGRDLFFYFGILGLGIVALCLLFYMSQ